MATKSLQEIYRCLAKVEVTRNSDPATTAGTDSVLLSEPPDWSHDFRLAPTNVAIDDTLTHQFKDILQSAMMSVRLRGWMQGSGTLGSTSTAGFAGQDAIFQAAGMKSTATPSTGPIAYTPAAIYNSDEFKSVWLDMERHLETQEAGGTVGNLVISGTAQERVSWEFSGMAHYRASAIGSLRSSYALTDRTEVFTGVTGGIKPSDGSTYNSAGGMILAGFSFNRGISVGTCIDAFSTYGINKFFVPTKPRPTFSVTIAADKAAANLDVADIPPDITGRTDHGVEFAWGTTPNKCIIAAPTAQLLGFTRAYANGYETLTLNYFLRHSTKETEFSISIGNPSLAIAT